MSFLLLTDTAPRVQLAPLSAHGRLIHAGAEPWRWNGVSGFLAGARLANGEDVRPVLDWYADTGFNVVRVFLTMDIVPRQRGMAPFILTNDQVQPLLEQLGRRGLYAELTTGDLQILMPNHDDQRRYLESIVAGVNPCEHNNEPFKNGMDVARMGRVGSAFQASGNYRFQDVVNGNVVTQTMPAVLDYFTYHTERKPEWPRTPHDAEEFFDGWNTIATGGPYKGKRVVFAGVHAPIVLDEPTGADEVPIGNSRSNVPADFFDYAAAAALMSAGATFHSSAGIDTVVPGPVTQECARQWVAAMRAIPLDAPLGQYTRGGASLCPIAHSDATALRTYAKLQGNKATAVVIRPTQHRAEDRVGVNGWRVVGTAGDRHNIVYLER